MPVEGDYPKLRKLIADIEAGGREVMGNATDAAKTAVGEEYSDDFSKQRDPWGERWKPTREGKSPVLLGETLALSNPSITRNGPMVRLKAAPHWVFHQIGANNMERRAVLPFGPSDWDEPIQDKIEDAVTESFPRGDE